MRAFLAGSGPVGGFPVPGCSCATCSPSSVVRRSARLELESGLFLDAVGVLHSAAGPVPLTSPVRLPGTTIIPVRDGVELASADGTRLLWASSAVAAAPASGGSVTTAVLPFPAAPRLARLRASSVVAAETTVHVVGLTHDAGPALDLRLAAWGAHLPSDGTDLLPAPPPRPGLRGRTLLLGGSGSGKSALAEDLLAAEPEVLYVATGAVPGPDDLEWGRRVAGHRQRRPAWWSVEETGTDPARLARLLSTVAAPVLLDSVGSWLTAALDSVSAWDDAPGWRDRLTALTDDLVAAWRARRGVLVAVAEEVGASVVPATAAGRLFVTELGRLDQRLAAESERTFAVMAGRVLRTA